MHFRLAVCPTCRTNDLFITNSEERKSHITRQSVGILSISMILPTKGLTGSAAEALPGFHNDRPNSCCSVYQTSAKQLVSLWRDLEALCGSLTCRRDPVRSSQRSHVDLDCSALSFFPSFSPSVLILGHCADATDMGQGYNSRIYGVGGGASRRVAIRPPHIHSSVAAGAPASFLEVAYKDRLLARNVFCV